MAREAQTETTGRINYVDSDWSAADNEFFKALDDSGLLLTYAQKMAFYTWRLSIVVQGGGGSLAVIASADGVTLTSELLAGVKVIAISMDRQIRTRRLDDAHPGDFYKGAISDSEEAQTASNTITLTNGSAFYAGQTVLILPGQ